MLTCSWGQEIELFHYTDLSHQKWLMPTHKQHFIKRMTKERKPFLAHAWINGQGIQLWENIFGTMNLWNSTHRQWLRKMNTIWKTYGKLYLTDDWKPFIPLENKQVLASQWIVDGNVITNFVDTTGISTTVNIEVAISENLKYFDLWNGEELVPYIENGKSFVKIKVSDFGCLLQTSDVNEKLAGLLQIQKKETSIPLLANDKYEQELSLKESLKYDYKKSENSGFTPGLLEVEGGRNAFTSKHIWREGRCYPNRDAKHNHDLEITFEDGTQRITHSHQENISSFSVPYGEKAGGPQKYDSHVKYFLMYPGMDRASTIGFRCLLNN